MIFMMNPINFMMNPIHLVIYLQSREAIIYFNRASLPNPKGRYQAVLRIFFSLRQKKTSSLLLPETLFYIRFLCRMYIADVKSCENSSQYMLFLSSEPTSSKRSPFILLTTNSQMQCLLLYYLSRLSLLSLAISPLAVLICPSPDYSFFNHLFHPFSINLLQVINKIEMFTFFIRTGV